MGLRNESYRFVESTLRGIIEATKVHMLRPHVAIVEISSQDAATARYNARRNQKEGMRWILLACWSA
jgi:hypothetical protein